MAMATQEGHVRVIHEFKDGKKKNGQFGGLYILGKQSPLKGLSDILNSMPKVTSLSREGVYF